MGQGLVGQTSPHPEWRVILVALSVREYGAVVSHDEISALTGLRYPSSRYFNQVSRARQVLLRDWQREIEVDAGRGYRLVEPTEFHGRSRREVRLAGRRVRRAQAILVAAPQKLLSDEENRRNADALAKLGRLEAMRRGHLRDTRPSLPAPPRADVPKMITG